MADQKHLVAQLPLSGKLRTALHGTQLGEGDFQDLTNMRYGELSPKSIQGMLKVHSDHISHGYETEYKHLRQGFQFRKSQPSESHMIVQSHVNQDTLTSTSALFKSATAIADSYEYATFDVAPWHTDASGHDIGRFSEAPDGCMIYCNGVESLVWGGNEYRCSGFVVGDLIDSLKKDYTSIINNSLTDTANVTTLTTVSGTVDAYTMLLLHCDGSNNGTTFTDSSPTTVHTMTARGNAKLSTAAYKFATASGLFDGNGDWIDTGDDPDFDFDDGTWTVDFWMNHTATAGDGTEGLYFHGTDATNYMALTLERASSLNSIKLSIYATTEVVSLQTTAGTITDGTWYHIEAVGDAADYYIFIDGVLAATSTDADLPADYTGLVYIGCTYLGSAGNYFKGNLDEYRVSNIARHTVNFSPPTVEYGTTAAYVYVASTRPIQGAKFYVAHANTAASSVGVKNWYAGLWHDVTSVVDGTVSGGSGITLQVTGSITWTPASPEDSKPRMFNGKYAYWYLFTFSDIEDHITISQVTLDAALQNIVDLWDGIGRPVVSCLKWVQANNAYVDKTTGVLKEDFLGIDVLSYMPIHSLPTTGYFLCGFDERTAGINVTMAEDHENTNKSKLSVYYWNGSAWTEVTGLQDGTNQNNKSFRKSGTITWDSPASTGEFQTSIASGKMLYYYKFKFDAALADGVDVDYITGIPSQRDMYAYDYCTMWQNRVVLVSEHANKKNSVLIGARDTVCVFNGEDSAELLFGNDEEATAAAPLFTRFGGSVYENLVVFKRNEIWIVDGLTPDKFEIYKIADNYGCVGPGSLKSCNTGYEVSPGLMKHVLIWQAEGAVCLFDGNSVISISNDIADKFEKQTRSTSFNPYVSEAFYDESLNEYHLLMWCSDFLSYAQEFVYDVTKKKWFEIERGTDRHLQAGFPARDIYGVNYTYGLIDTGFVEHLEYSSSMNGEDYDTQFRIGDIALGRWFQETKIRKVKHIARAKLNNANNVPTLTHYGDCILTATDSTVAGNNYSLTGGVAIKTESVNWGNHIFHSVKCVVPISTSGIVQDVGYQPIGLAFIYEVVREDIL